MIEEHNKLVYDLHYHKNSSDDENTFKVKVNLNPNQIPPLGKYYDFLKKCKIYVFWCENNCKSNWNFNFGHRCFYFENKTDAALFALLVNE